MMPPAKANWCVVCAWRPVKARGRCATCYVYWRRHGRDRPEEIVIRENRRVMNERDEVKAWGGPMPAPPSSAGERLRQRSEEATRERQERRSR